MRKPWLGGFIHEAEDGTETYVIRKQVAGKRYEISTRCGTERAALKQLERFEADPANYAPGSDGDKEVRAPLLLDAALGVEFLTYSRDVKKNSAPWLYQQKRYTAWWAKQLHGINLRKVTLKGHINPALDAKKDAAGTTIEPAPGGRAHRIATIKAIYAWLRTVKSELTVAEDPTFATLKVPQSKPGARSMKHKEIPKRDYLKARKHLEGHWRAAFDLQLGTAWHKTEVKRFAEGGAIEPHPSGKVKGVAGVLMCPEAKGGGELRTPVGRAVMAAAKVLLERKSFSIERYDDAIKAACLAAGLNTHFTAGRFRHTVATAAINSGADRGQVSAFLNHKDPRTLKRFYATNSVTAKIPTPL